MEDKKDYEFVTETIKKKPLNKRKMLVRLAYSIGLGFVAGLVACVVFAYFAPRFYERVNPANVSDETVPVTIPKDDNAAEEESIEKSEIGASNNAASNAGVSEIVNQTDSSDNNTKEPESDSILDSTDGKTANSNDTENDVPDEKMAENTSDGEETEEPALVQEIITKELEIEDYKNLYVKFKEINYNTSKSLATVTLVSDNTDWFMNNYETGNKFTGIILADNGRELLIIANIDKQDKNKDIDVTFCDGTTYKGTIKKSDPNTGLTVVAVHLNTIADSTKNSIEMAELGNSSISSLVGTPVMAVGSPLGIDGSMQLGLVTSSTHTLEFPDSSLRYITTDMYGSTDGSGVIIDLDGKVVGIIFHGGSSSESRNLIRAYGISDIKAKIEKLSNGQDLAYLGIIGTDVTHEAVEELGVPEGTYVKQVVIDSPAMRSGVRNGDVIVKFGTADITRFSEFKEAMLKSQPGDNTVLTVKRPGKDKYIELTYEITLEALQNN